MLRPALLAAALAAAFPAHADADLDALRAELQEHEIQLTKHASRRWKCACRQPKQKPRSHAASRQRSAPGRTRANRQQ